MLMKQLQELAVWFMDLIRPILFIVLIILAVKYYRWRDDKFSKASKAKTQRLAKDKAKQEYRPGSKSGNKSGKNSNSSYDSKDSNDSSDNKDKEEFKEGYNQGYRVGTKHGQSGNMDNYNNMGAGSKEPYDKGYSEAYDKGFNQSMSASKNKTKK